MSASFAHIPEAFRLYCTEQFPLPTEKEIAYLEESCKLRLPPDYRNFLQHYGGGLFSEPCILPSVNNCPQDSLTSMYGIHSPYSFATLGNLGDILTFEDNDPPIVIPIGDTVMNSWILVMIHPEDCGKIVFKEAFGGFYYLADGIDDFFGRLVTPCK